MKRIVMGSLLIAVVSLASIGWAQAAETQAVILGPTTAQPGDLVILDAASSTQADAYVWRLIASEKTFLPIEDGRKVVFASGKPGAYTFALAVAGVDAEGTAVVSLAVHTITIGEKPLPPPAPDEPTPDGFRGAVTVAVRSLPASAHKAAPLIAALYESVAASAENDPTGYQPRDMVAEVKSRLSSELSLDQITAWQPFWPLLAEAFVELQLTGNDTNGHIEAFRTVAQCLLDAS